MKCPFVMMLALAALAAGIALPRLLSAQPLEKESVKVVKLDNGMTFLLLERHLTPTFSAVIRFNVGAVDERPGLTGTAHLLEHMLFKGTDTLGTRDYEAEKPYMEQAHMLAKELKTEEERLRREREALPAVPGAEEEPPLASPRLADIRDRMRAMANDQRRFIVKDEIWETYLKNGGSRLNASTGSDTTQYFVSLPANKLELWAFIEAGRMDRPVFREFYSERDVVQEERRRSIETQPFGKLMEQFGAAAFTAHPYGAPVVGWMSDIHTVMRDEVEQFFHEYYTPSNAVCALVGDFKAEDAEAVVRRYFGSIPAGPRPPRVETAEPRQKGERRVAVEFDAEARLAVGWHATDMFHADQPVSDVIQAVLGNGGSSRLQRRLVREKRLAASVDIWGPRGKYPDTFIIMASPLRPHTVAEVERAILEEIDRLKTEPIGDAEMLKVKNNIEASFIRGMRSNLDLALRLSDYELLWGDWKALFGERERRLAVTAADVKRFAQTYFTASNRTVAWLQKPAGAGMGAGEGEKNADPKRAKHEKVVATAAAEAAAPSPTPGGPPPAIVLFEPPPDPLALRGPRTSRAAAAFAAMKFPAIQWKVPEVGPPGSGKEVERVVLSNGMVVYLMEDHSLPTFNVQAKVRTGSVYEGDDKQGLAPFTGTLLKLGGTRDLTVEAFDEKLESIAGSASTSISDEEGNVSVQVMSKDIDTGLSMFTDLLRRPAFRQDKIDFQKEQIKESIRRSMDSPGEVAQRVFDETVYGGHAYGRPYHWRYVAAFTRNDVEGFYRRFFHPGNVMLAAVGDFQRDDLLGKLDQAFGGWEATGGALPPPARVKEAYPAGVYFVHKDINQSNIRMGHLGSTWDDPDRHAVQVLNYILGGGSFTSRLTSRVRSDEGLAYHIGSRYNLRRDLGTFVASCETRAGKTAYTIALMRDIIEKMRNEPVPLQELQAAKDAFVNRYVFSFETPEDIVSQLMSLEFYDRPRDLLQTYIADIEKITPGDVQRVARERLRPDRMTIVVVGDDTRFDASLGGFGDVIPVKLEEEIP